jgi:thioredoxin reductase (NADPH)
MATDSDIAFPTLTDQELAALAARGHPRDVRAGDVLFAAGDRGFCFYVVLQGSIPIVDIGPEGERLIVTHGPRQFSGDVDMLTGRAAVVTARVAEDGQVLELSAAELRRAVDELPEVGDTIVKAFLMRRQLLLSSGFVGVRIIGSRFSPAAHRLRDFATRNAIPCKFIDLETDEQADALLRQLGIAPSETPVVIGRDGASSGTRPSPTSPAVPGSPPPWRRTTSTISWWSAPVPRASRHRSTRPPRGSTCSPPTRWPPAGRPAPARGSRTTWASRRVSPARNSPGAP